MPVLLLFEDDPLDAELLQRRLQAVDESIQVVWHTDLTDGPWRADLVLIDMHLPSGAGLDLVRTAVARAGGVPVLAMSGSTDIRVEDVVAAGGVGIVAKGDWGDDVIRQVIEHLP